MSKIKQIESKILTLGSGEFQRMCDALLFKKGYRNIMALGTHVGTDKTTKGTPDTYFVNIDGSYTLVAYTTEAKFSKIKQDILNCFDETKTKISNSKVSKVIHYHTSTNLTAGQDEELRKICEDNNAIGEIYGLNELAYEIGEYYQEIAQDYLDISIDTNQILTIDRFVKNHDSYITSVPLNTKFICRETELSDILNSINNNQTTIITGGAGVGKTRIVLEACTRYIEQNNDWELLCIRNNNLPLYDELKMKIGKNKKYLLFVDDSNVFNNLEHILEYLELNNEKEQIKIITTIRSYALNQVVRSFEKYSKSQIIDIKAMKDEDIKQLIKDYYKITNPAYIKIILRVASGNPRMALMASKIAVDGNNLESIANSSQLYDSYFNDIIEKISKDGVKTLKVAGVIAFIEGINLDKQIKTILELTSISEEDFKNECLKLHELEILDMLNEKAFKISEQCMQNYLLYYVFYKKKLLSLSQMIDMNFGTQKEVVLRAVNVLMNIFYSKEMYSFIETEVNIVWDKYKKENSEKFHNYIMMFHHFRPLEVLEILKDEISNTEKTNYKVTLEDFNDNKNHFGNDDIVEILDGFGFSEYFDMAFELLIEYYHKKPDTFKYLVKGFCSSMGIDDESHIRGYELQRKIFNKFKEKLSDYSDYNLVVLFLKIAKNYLRFEYECTTATKKREISFCRVHLIYNKGSEEYRSVLWEQVLNIYDMGLYNEFVNEIMNDYNIHGDCSNDIALKIDKSYIEQILNKMSPENFNNILIVDKLNSGFLNKNNKLNGIEAFLNNEMYVLYKTLKRNYREISDKAGHKRHNKISKYLADYSREDYSKLFQQMKIISDNTKSDYDFSDSVEYMIRDIISRSDDFLSIIELYFQNDVPFNIHPKIVIELLLEKYDFIEIETKLNQYEYKNKNNWMFILYTCVPEKYINNDYLERVYAFIEQEEGEITGWLRDLDFLDKFISLDSNVYIKITDIILKKNRFILHLYTALLFNIHHTKPEKLIKRYSNNISKLKELYFIEFDDEKNFDYNDDYIISFLAVEISFIDGIMERILDNKFYFPSKYEQVNLSFVWNNSNTELYLDYINKNYIQKYVKDKTKIQLIFDALLFENAHEKSGVGNDKKKWIENIIKNNASNDDIILPFMDVLLEKIPEDLFIEMVGKLIKYNDNYVFFEKVSLSSWNLSWSGSMVPLCENKIEYFKKLKTNLIGVKFLKHIKLIEEHIKYWEKKKIEEQLDDFLE